ncbi:hypothetical protein NDU88_003422 [Pleurodeles waltl]|uniref:Uncharacterized protein n=1 Tax=Pleurodeles waltl TaxID=8319 RepID=A0AAV7M3Y1_PLEWA|nr:hypothetical protein NDU88_003422 [Pleurodeles waltl]
MARGVSACLASPGGPGCAHSARGPWLKWRARRLLGQIGGCPRGRPLLIALLSLLISGAKVWWRLRRPTCTALCFPPPVGPKRQLCQTTGARGGLGLIICWVLAPLLQLPCAWSYFGRLSAAPGLWCPGSDWGPAVDTWWGPSGGVTRASWPWGGGGFAARDC